MNPIKNILVKITAWINYKIQSKRNIKNSFITYCGGWDGACAQAHSIISILLFAKKYNLTYAHSSLKNIEHYQGDKSEWSKRWEDFFSLGNNEINVDTLDKNNLKFKKLKYPFLLNKKSNTVYCVSNCHSYTDKFASQYELILDSLREKYLLNKKKEKQIDKKCIKICLHIRRGDVSKTNKNAFRYTENHFLIKNLRIICETMTGLSRPYSIYIFSQGEASDFVDFNEFNPVYLLNDDEFETFDSLVNADILIMAKSSFSYVAALLNKGIVLYEPFWHHPLPRWINLQLPEKLLIKGLNKNLKSCKNEV